MTINLEGIRALLFPEKKEDKGPKFILTDQEFGFIVKDELKEDATITAANMEMKVQAAVNKCVIDYGKRKLLTDIKDAKIYTLADFKKALGIVENEPAQGHVLTEEEFAWIVQEMLKPGSGVSNIDQINTAFIKQLEGSMPSDKRGKDRIMAKSYSVQTFKDEVRNALDRQREQEMKKQVNLTPSKLHLVLYGMYSARVAQDRPPIPSNIASAVNEAQRIWKAPVDVKEVDQTYTYQQIFDLYKKFDPNKRELGGEVKTKGFLTEGEFQLVIARLKNVLVKTAGTVTIDDFNNVKIPDDKVEKGPKVVRRQYTLNEIKTALEGGAEKKEKGKDEFEMNDAIVAFVIKKLKQQSIDPKNLKLGDVDEVILSNAGDLKDARFSGPKLLVTLETIREKLRQAYVSYQPKMRAPGELDAIGERFIFPYGAEGSIKKYDVRRLVADGPDGKREYGLFVQALSTEAGKRNEDMNNNLKELERRIKGEFKVVLVEEQD